MTRIFYFSILHVINKKQLHFKLFLTYDTSYFIGESAVGKSSLVLRFVKGQFHEFQEVYVLLPLNY